MRKIIVLSVLATCLLLIVANTQADEQTVANPDCIAFVNCPRGIGTSHCEPVSFQFEAVNARNEKPNHGVRYHLAYGPGQIDERTGLWTFDPKMVDISEWGQRFKVMVVATQGRGKHADTCRFSVRIYNYAPRPFLPGPYHKDSIPVVAGAYNTIPIWWLDRDSCDYIRKYLMSVDPSPDGLYWLTDEGNIEFYPKAPDTGKFFTFRLMAHDGIDSNFLDVRLFVTSPPSWSKHYAVEIEKLNDVTQGDFVDVNVNVNAANTDVQVGGMGGFDLLLTYDHTALSLQLVTVDSSAFYSECKWEYFTYRFGADGNCGPACPSGLVRVVGIAETNNGNVHPSCLPDYLPDLPATLFTLRFLVSNDRTFECQFVPVRFFWIDCGDNCLTNRDGSQLHIANSVSDSIEAVVPIDPATASFPGYAGVQEDSCAVVSPNRPATMRTIDFYNGGITIACPSIIDPRGDINLNNIAFEVADCVMFRNYFVYGLAAFHGHVPGSMAASDVNKDGLTLTLADYVYLQHIIVGDANPIPPAPSSDTAHLYLSNQSPTVTLASPDTIGAISLVFEGDVHPGLIVQTASMRYATDSGRTSILISGECGHDIPQLVTGPILNGTAGHRLLRAEAATYQGAVIPLVIMDANPSTTRGDINADGVPFEPADYDLFYHYFLFDTAVFQGHTQASVDASDINLDGSTLTIADLLYMWRVIHGDSLPYPQAVDSGDVATFYHPSGSIGQLYADFPDTLGAIYLLMEGSAGLSCWYGGDCESYYDGTNTHVLLAPSDTATSIFPIADERIILYGSMWDLHLIIKVQAATYDGAVMPTELGGLLDAPDDGTPSVPQSFALHQNYPNPFNAGTVISFDLPRAADVRLEVLNIAGQVVHEVNRHYAAGSHEIEWDGTVGGRSVASGVYYYRISAGEFAATKKMVLLK